MDSYTANHLQRWADQHVRLEENIEFVAWVMREHEKDPERVERRGRAEMYRDFVPLDTIISRLDK